MTTKTHTFENALVLARPKSCYKKLFDFLAFTKLVPKACPYRSPLNLVKA